MKALVVGSVNIDYTLKVEKMVKEGETISSSKLLKNLGGKGFNQAVALARNFNEVYLYANINKEDDFIYQDMLKNKIRLDFVNRVVEETGAAFIQLDKKGNNAIVVSGNANHTLNLSDIKKNLSYFNKDDLMFIQNEVNDIEKIIQLGSEAGMKTVYNPSPFIKEVIPKVLPFVNYLVVNHHELADVLEGRRTEEFLKEYPHLSLIVTYGVKGSRYLTLKENIYQKSYIVDVVDTTCAGDTYLGFFFGGLMNNKPIKESMDLAAKAASICVSRLGASNSIPTLNEIK